MDNQQIIKPNQEIVLCLDSIKQAEKWEDLISLWCISKEFELKTNWFKGEIVKEVEVKYGEQSLKEFAKSVGEKYDTIISYRRAVRAFPEDKRSYNLHFSHYLLASNADSWNEKEQKFETDSRFGWIEKAHDNSWSVSRMKYEMAEHKAKESNETLFQYYSNTARSFSAIVKQWEINQLKTEQREELLRILDSLVSEFKNMVLQIQETKELDAPSI